jgi:luciferase family oxidoreductase group 1
VLPVSILDLAPIVEGGTPGQALRNSIDLVRHAERLGYRRYWVAEHHNLAGIASAATSVVIAHLADATESIRVGAGGIMLPNHAPLVIAEQFGTLEALHPGRIDLGLGRAPGTDQVTLRALRGDPTADSFPQDVLELQALLGDPLPGQAVFAIPGVGSHVPLWIPARASTARNSRRRSGSRMRSPRTSRPICCCRRSRCTARASNRRRSSRSPT